MPYYTPPGPEQHIKGPPRSIVYGPNVSDAQLRAKGVRLITAAWVDAMERVLWGTWWQDSPQDNMRLLPVTGEVPPLIRAAYRAMRDSGQYTPMPQELADALALALRAEVPTLAHCKNPTYPVFDHLLVPAYLSLVFDPSLELGDRVVDALSYTPEVYRAGLRVLSPHGVDLCDGVRVFMEEPTLEPHPSPVEFMSQPPTMLRWITDALEPLGCEFSRGSVGLLAYVAGKTWVELHARWGLPRALAELKAQTKCTGLGEKPVVPANPPTPSASR